jgi:3-dehydroquinate synthase
MSESDNRFPPQKLEPIKVELGERSYFVHFDEDWREILASYSDRKIAIISDRNVASHHLLTWKNILPNAVDLVLPPGEKTKCSKNLEEIYNFLVAKNFSRDGMIIALGGGVIGDLAGFAAATFMRGMDFVLVPTSLLAMVDAAVGGKVGINLPLGKNLVGAFHQPKAVLVDFQHLNTLPVRDWLCGLGEMFKYALISGEIDFQHILSGIEKCKPCESWECARNIRKCIEIKAGIVSRDERETQGERIILNFGHTIGHALEAATEFHTFCHGEAVIAGMAGALFMAEQRRILPTDDFHRLLSTLSKFPFPTFKEMVTTQQLVDFIMHDKKVQRGRVRFVLLEAVGKVRVVQDISDDELSSAVTFALNFVAHR